MPATPNPWDRPVKIKSDNYVPSTFKLDHLHWAIGKALAHWALMENELAKLFIGFFASDEQWAVGQLYGTFPSLSVQLRAISTISEVQFRRKEKHLDYLKKVVSLVEKFSARRNDIAHGVTYVNPDGFADICEPMFSVAHEKRLAGNYGYTFDGADVARYAEWFQYLRHEVLHCKAVVWSQPGWCPDTPLTPYLEPQKTAFATMLKAQAASAVQAESEGQTEAGNTQMPVAEDPDQPAPMVQGVRGLGGDL